MKKIISIILILIILIGLTGCSMSKERIIKKSTRIYVGDLTNELNLNFKTAKEKYEENIYEITAGVISIEENFAKLELSDETFCEKQYMEVYFKDDDLRRLKMGQRINFVGKISNITKTNNNLNIKVKKAHYISDEFEISGRFEKIHEECYDIIVNGKLKKRCNTHYHFEFDENSENYMYHDASGYYYKFNETSRKNIYYDCSGGTIEEIKIIDGTEEIIKFYDDWGNEIEGIKIKDGDEVTMKIKLARDVNIDENNIIDADKEWDITEIISIKVNE